MFRVPYRWLPRTIIPNIRSCWCDVTNGVRNLWRWIPIIWFDADFDWDYMARVIEAKLEWMAEDARTWITRHHERDRKQMLICLTLIRRLRDDEYWQRASRQLGETGAASKLAMANATYEQQYLGRLLGKYLRNWWE